MRRNLPRNVQADARLGPSGEGALKGPHGISSISSQDDTTTLQLYMFVEARNLTRIAVAVAHRNVVPEIIHDGVMIAIGAAKTDRGDLLPALDILKEAALSPKTKSETRQKIAAFIELAWNIIDDERAKGNSASIAMALCHEINICNEINRAFEKVLRKS